VDEHTFDELPIVAAVWVNLDVFDHWANGVFTMVKSTSLVPLYLPNMFTAFFHLFFTLKKVTLVTMYIVICGDIPFVVVVGSHS
jgi:hypothetical protein